MRHSLGVVEMFAKQLSDSRFSGDQELLSRLQNTPEIASELAQVDPQRYQVSLRTHLLSSAVRVESSLLPSINMAFNGVRERSNISEPMEAYVYEAPAINAFVARGRKHVFVVLSSAAVTHLSEEELGFVIGHEIGHAMFGHLDVPTKLLLGRRALNASHRMQIMAWQRSAEISADRCGLICCGSLQIAANAMFKTLSGLGGTDLKVQPSDFTRQWDHLLEEVLSVGDGDYWEMTHPFPPLRMKAMSLYWDSNGKEFGGELPSPGVRHPSDLGVARLLAMMDPLARDLSGSADPVLEKFLLWGGLCLGLADGELRVSEETQLEKLVSKEVVANVFAAGVPTAEYCLEQFSNLITDRTTKLSALEIHRIMAGLLEVAASDGCISDIEEHCFKAIGRILGIPDEGGELLLVKCRERM